MERDQPPWFLGRSFCRQSLQSRFCLLYLFFYLLFPSLVLILLAFVAHRVPPFPLSRRQVSRPQLLKQLMALRRYVVHSQFELIELSLTSDLKGIAFGYEIFLCEMFGAGIGNLTVGLLIPRHDRPTLLFYEAASLPNILPLHFAELPALL
mgnify:CR=1 FL=1